MNKIIIKSKKIFNPNKADKNTHNPKCIATVCCHTRLDQINNDNAITQKTPHYLKIVATVWENWTIPLLWISHSRVYQLGLLIFRRGFFFLSLPSSVAIHKGGGFHTRRTPSYWVYYIRLYTACHCQWLCLKHSVSA